MVGACPDHHVLARHSPIVLLVYVSWHQGSCRPVCAGQAWTTDGSETVINSGSKKYVVFCFPQLLAQILVDFQNQGQIWNLLVLKFLKQISQPKFGQIAYVGGVLKTSGPADFKSVPGFENLPRFVGLIEQNKMQRTFCHHCIKFDWIYHLQNCVSWSLTDGTIKSQPILRNLHVKNPFKYETSWSWSYSGFLSLFFAIFSLDSSRHFTNSLQWYLGLFSLQAFRRQY